MALMVDTHAFLWFVLEDRQLSERARDAIENGSPVCFVSSASIWEMAIKYRTGKLNIKEPLAAFLEAELNANRFILLTPTMADYSLISTLPLHHRDPFDRMLVAQCQTQNLELVSADSELDAYGIRRIW